MTDYISHKPPKQPKFSLWAITLTLLIIVINIGVYFYQLHYAAPLPSPENNLLLFGANVYQLSLTGDWWRYPVSMVLHSSNFHLGLNCLALLVIGIECERSYGKFRMLVIYLFSGMGAAFFSAYWQYHQSINEAIRRSASNSWENIDKTIYVTVGVGASGAIMGLAAASVIYFLKAINDSSLPPEYRNKLKRPLYNIIAMIGLTLVNGLQSGIDNAAHIGGAIIGAMVSVAFVLAPQSTRRAKNLSNLIITLAASGLLLLILHNMSSLQDDSLVHQRQFIYQEINKQLDGLKI